MRSFAFLDTLGISNSHAQRRGMALTISSDREKAGKWSEEPDVFSGKKNKRAVNSSSRFASEAVPTAIKTAFKDIALTYRRFDDRHERAVASESVEENG